MPSNNLDLYRFIRFLLDAGADERLVAGQADPGDRTRPAAGSAGSRSCSIAGTSSRCSARACSRAARACCRCWRGSRLGAGPRRHVQSLQAHPGRHAARQRSTRRELIGAADFPADLQAAPARGHASALGRQQHLARRAQSVGRARRRRDAVRRSIIDAIERIAALARANCSRRRAPIGPMPAAVARGAAIYMAPAPPATATQDARRLRLRRRAGRPGRAERRARHRSRTGSIPTPSASATISSASSSRARRYQFNHFQKTDGYANLPLDGLWLRAPYLHNGSVPTLADLLEPPEQRPKAFLRGSDVIDPRARRLRRARHAIRTPRRRRAASASTPACPATAMAGMSTAPACRPPKRRICWPIC